MLLIENTDLALRPGLTATADIVTDRRENVMLVPNAALRFVPSDTQKKSSILGGIGPAGMFKDKPKVGKVERGSKATIYVLDETGQPAALGVVVGASDGKQTEVSGDKLKPGMPIITSALAAAK